ncbi:hypothetical protein H5410_005729 [Solanum commersonii]|uniref:Uncharacterized protein n=1 Tax=Solanum commersonii TaxID=4109 RepID=A0A9J6A952_SOLCO|nr:hypothetical protein H5410_005729 [Solanum commersonii]
MKVEAEQKINQQKCRGKKGEWRGFITYLTGRSWIHGGGVGEVSIWVFIHGICETCKYPKYMCPELIHFMVLTSFLVKAELSHSPTQLRRWCGTSDEGLESSLCFGRLVIV